MSQQTMMRFAQCGSVLSLKLKRLLIEAMFVFLCRVQLPPAPVFTRQPFVQSSWQRPEARSGRSSRQPRRGRGLSRNKYSFSARITSHRRPGAGCWVLAPLTLASCGDLAVCPQKVSTKSHCNFHNMRARAFALFKKAPTITFTLNYL